MPTTRPRPDPIIPDHEVLRRFGGGAYGEVWLARGVTGALRAVKIVYREDFEDERGFEREFEGILKYEPMSRDHPALVNILHVGRSPIGGEFYYYVMELGDDIISGRDINPIEYEARTLRSDIKRAEGRRLDTGFCIDVGLRLAEALKHLHDNGLAHRDVKPANVIFVGGKAKLADIGLVAARGQQTFVGTEGFVPPEGPGSAQADVYSLGKVLYEMASGKDRLDFPELPDELPPGSERKQWLALNQVICDICEPRLSHRNIRTAGELAVALARLRAGKRRRRRTPVVGMLFSLFVGGVLAWGGWELWQRRPPAEDPVVVNPAIAGQQPVNSEPVLIKINSDPEGADVIRMFDEPGETELIGRTPLEITDAEEGETITFTLKRDGYHPHEETIEVPSVTIVKLRIDAPPVTDAPWTDHLGIDYRPLGDGHESLDFIGASVWNEYLEEENLTDDRAQMIEINDGGRKRKVAATGPAEASAFGMWLASSGVEEGYLTDDFEALPRFSDDFPQGRLSPAGRKAGWKPFRVLVRPIPYGRVMVTTDPPGADVYLNGLRRGATGAMPLLVDRARPGPIELVASLEGYKSETRQFRLEPRATKTIEIDLEENKSMVLTQPGENSLGMRFVPVGEDWMGSIWETRVVDYRAYARAVGTRMPLAPEPLPSTDSDFGNPDLHPVVNVSREDAEAFCVWLTEKEREEDRLTRSLEYRLPTDLEWSAMAGVAEDPDLSVPSRDRMKRVVFPWGFTWPPLERVGNLADLSTGRPEGNRVPGYDDGFPVTAPVGSFAPNDIGLFDLCGNAQEWVSDPYSSAAIGLLRGGGWETYQEQNLYIGSRNAVLPTSTNPTYGFRIVLAKKPPPEPEPGDLTGDDESS